MGGGGVVGEAGGKAGDGTAKRGGGRQDSLVEIYGAAVPGRWCARADAVGAAVVAPADLDTIFPICPQMYGLLY
eukprot:scaffold247758_cov27-Tisochrysis_lutea.AAC.1